MKELHITCEQFEFRGKEKIIYYKNINVTKSKCGSKSGQPKGVIGVPSQKKPILGTKNGVMCYYKLKPFEKDRFILECLLKPSVAFNALNGSRSVEATDITTNDIGISNDIRDETSIELKGLTNVVMKQHEWQC